MKNRPFDKILANTFLVILSIIVTFTVVEYVSRLFRANDTKRYAGWFYDIARTRKPKPYSMFAGNPERKGINSLGYRGKAPSLIKPLGEYRIFVLGGSTVFNGSPPIPATIEKELNKNKFKNYSKVSAYNFGFPSSKSGEELARLLFEIVDFQPDLVIVYDSANDLWETGGDPRPGYPFNFIVYEQNPLLIHDVNDYPIWTLLAYGSHIFRYFFHDAFQERFLKTNRFQVDILDPQVLKKKSEIYTRNILKMAKIAQSFNFRLAVFMQPLVFDKDIFHPHEDNYFRFCYENHPILDKKTVLQRVRKTREIIVPILQKKSQSEKFIFTDYTQIFRYRSECIFGDPVHLHQKYREEVGRKISQKILPYIDQQETL